MGRYVDSAVGRVEGERDGGGVVFFLHAGKGKLGTWCLTNSTLGR